MAQPPYPRRSFWKSIIFPLFFSSGIVLIAGIYLVAVFPNWLEIEIKSKLTASGFRSVDLRIESVSPWNAQLADVRLERPSLRLSAESVMVQYSPWKLLHWLVEIVFLGGATLNVELAGMGDTLEATAEDSRAEPLFQMHDINMPFQSITVHKGLLEIPGGEYPVLWPIDVYIGQRNSGYELTLLAGADSGRSSIQANLTSVGNEGSIQFVLTTSEPQDWLNLLRFYIPQGPLNDMQTSAESLSLEGEVMMEKGRVGEWFLLAKTDDFKANDTRIGFFVSQLAAGAAGSGGRLSRASVSGRVKSLHWGQANFDTFEFSLNYEADGKVVASIPLLPMHRLHRSDLNLENVVVEIELKESGLIILNRLEAESLDGRLWVEPLTYNPRLPDIRGVLCFESERAETLLPEPAGHVNQSRQFRVPLRLRGPVVEFNQTALVRQSDWDTATLADLLRDLGFKPVSNFLPQ